MAKKAKHEEHENLERWLVSYADFITLLFTFFVMMYAISAVNTGKYKVLSHAIVATFNHQTVQQNLHIIIPHSRSQPGKASPQVRTVLFRAMQLIQERSSSHGAMKVVQTSQGIRIRIQAAFLFRSGHAAVRKAALPTLRHIAGILAKTKRPIRVEGHTDNVPIHGRYKNNWALSTMRAVNVLTELIALGPIDPRQASAAGYSQYRPLVPNDSDADRQKNRRVEIVILKGAEKALPSPEPLGATGAASGAEESSGAPALPAPAPPASTDLPAPRI
jgi:chemotaxis protein MotB